MVVPLYLYCSISSCIDSQREISSGQAEAGHISTTEQVNILIRADQGVVQVTSTAEKCI